MRKPTSRALALHQSLWRRANAYGGQFPFSTQLLTLNYLLYSPTDAATVSLETYPLDSVVTPTLAKLQNTLLLIYMSLNLGIFIMSLGLAWSPKVNVLACCELLFAKSANWWSISQNNIFPKINIWRDIRKRWTWKKLDRLQEILKDNYNLNSLSGLSRTTVSQALRTFVWCLIEKLTRNDGPFPYTRHAYFTAEWWRFIHMIIQSDIQSSFNSYFRQSVSQPLKRFIRESIIPFIRFVLIAFALDNVLYCDSSF